MLMKVGLGWGFSMMLVLMHENERIRPLSASMPGSAECSSCSLKDKMLACEQAVQEDADESHWLSCTVHAVLGAGRSPSCW